MYCTRPWGDRLLPLDWHHTKRRGLQSISLPSRSSRQFGNSSWSSATQQPHRVTSGRITQHPCAPVSTTRHWITSEKLDHISGSNTGSEASTPSLKQSVTSTPLSFLTEVSHLIIGTFQLQTFTGWQDDLHDNVAPSQPVKVVRRRNTVHKMASKRLLSLQIHDTMSLRPSLGFRHPYRHWHGCWKPALSMGS